MPKLSRIKLKNGLTILHARLPENATTTVAVFVRAGSEYEKKEENGISHFLEHMCFRGSKRYPNHAAIAEAFELIGTSPEAFTSNEYTYYYAKVANQDFSGAAGILFDICLNPLLGRKEILKERGVVIEEMNMNDDDPQSIVWDSFLRLLYPDSSAGRKILGTKESVHKFSQKKLLAYHHLHYSPERMVVSVVGSVPLALVRKQVNKVFGSLKKKKDFPKPVIQDAQKEFREFVLRKNSHQTNFVLGFRAFPITDRRKYALRILEEILGGTESSRLWRKIYGEMGAAYSVGTASALSSDHGYFTISGGIENSKFEKVLTVIRSELRDILACGVSTSEFTRIKKYVVANQKMNNETSDDWVLFFGEQETTKGKTEKPEDIIKEYEKVTQKEIRELARFLFKNERMNLVIVGPVKKKSFSNKVLF